ncbi:MAG: glycosyltransferase, partial [Planctomycetota bacterium]|nr:glycosyltransferase [Planctomycetota bacterium]
MKLVWVTTSFPRWPGDWQGNFIAAAARALAQRGHDVRVLCPGAAEIPAAAAWEGLRLRRFRYAPFARWERLAYGAGIPDNLRRQPWLYLLVPFFLRALAKAIAEEAPACDLVHAHWAVCGAMAAPACQRHGRPLVVSLRGSDLASPSIFLQRWVRQACAASDTIVCPSEGVQRLARGSGALLEKLQVVGNGLDWAAIAALPRQQEARQRLGLSGDGLLVISVGRLIPLKRHEILLRAFSQATVDLTPQPRLAIVGDGPERKRLQKTAAALGLAERAHLVGDVPPSTVLLWLRASDIFALASEREGRSNALAEAMAVGLPCLVTPGAEGGLLSNAAEPCGIIAEASAWSSALGRLLRDSALRQAL